MALSFETLIKSNGYRFPTVRSRFQSGAIDTRGVGIVENNNNAAPVSSSPSSSVVGNAVVDIPVSCYQLIGVSSQAEKDEIVKSVMNLKGSEVDDGYTSDVVVSRQEILMDVRDKLLFETEYAGNVKEKIPPKSSLRIPWRWLPAAVCLLQEVGEEELVLEVGRAAIQRTDAKPYIHDLLLSMALAECSIAKIGFEKNKVSEGFEALARAQCLLRSTKSLKQMMLLSQIIKAKTICECLITSEGTDLKLEEAFCLFLLGQGSEAEIIEKLQQLESDSNRAPQNSITGKEKLSSSSTNSSLEIWLKDAVLSRFPDTRDCSPSLANYFGGERRAPRSKKIKGSPQTIPNLGHRSLPTALASERRDFEDSLPRMKSSLHIVSAVKQLGPTDLQSPLVMGDDSGGSNVSSSSVQLERKFGVNQNKTWESWFSQSNVTERVTFVAILGCIVLTSCKLSGMNLSGVRRMSIWASSKPHMNTSSLTSKGDSFLDYNIGSPRIKAVGIGVRIKKLLDLAKVQFMNPSEARNSRTSCLPASLSTSITTVDTKQMSVEEAEALVRQWQAIKAEALGPNHQVDTLSEALDESMLIQWQALADMAKARCCYWRFVLLQLTILRADILLDIHRGEIAEIEALLEEAAELVDESQPKNPNYYSAYKIRYILRRQDDGSWKFCGGDIEMPS
ncbi:hypothetical protein GOBAR_DD18854 [Gossypium barbadense]|nr:hypothetical protein GOBAR_DD18854 [Gossypium barbadense]